MPDVAALYQDLKRVRYIPQMKARTYQDAADDIAVFIREKTSVLAIVNTKDAPLIISG